MPLRSKYVNSGMVGHRLGLTVDYFDDDFWPIAFKYSGIDESVHDVLGASAIGVSESAEVTCNDNAQRSSKSRIRFRRQRWTLSRLFQLGKRNGRLIRTRC